MIPPAQLWIGQPEHLQQKALEWLQQRLCPNKGCNKCFTCKQIKEKQHHALLWLDPVKQYSLEMLEPIFNTITFTLDVEQHFYIILSQADTLTALCANKLLKSMEEPPTGYHFVLLAQHKKQVLETVQSRCIISYFQNHEENELSNPIYKIFTHQMHSDPLSFLQLLEKMTINELDTAHLVDAIVLFWMKQQKQNYMNLENNNTATIDTMLNHFHDASDQLPMPGGSKIFWKNLYLKVF